MRAKRKYLSKPDYVTHPGKTLEEFMLARKMKQKELATRTGLTVQTLIRILKGQQPITYETANKLEFVTDYPARFWNNLEMQYQERKIRLEEEERLEGDLEWLISVPTKELISRGVIEQAKEKVELLRNTLKFYGVSSVAAWKAIWDKPVVRARRTYCFETKLEATSAWLRQGQIEAREIKCKPFVRKKFASALKEVKGLTSKSVKEFGPAVTKLCADSGVAFVVVKEMQKAPWHGATMWLSPKKAMIILCLRGKREDSFWFSFFHEACHVLNDAKTGIFVNDGKTRDTSEIRADEFAGEYLVPKKCNSRILSATNDKDILGIAQELGVTPGVVAGRYRYLTKKWTMYNGLIRKFAWIEN